MDDNPDIVYYLESLRIANDNINGISRKKPPNSIFPVALLLWVDFDSNINNSYWYYLNQQG